MEISKIRLFGFNVAMWCSATPAEKSSNEYSSSQQVSTSKVKWYAVSLCRKFATGFGAFTFLILSFRSPLTRDGSSSRSISDN